MTGSSISGVSGLDAGPGEGERHSEGTSRVSVAAGLAGDEIAFDWLLDEGSCATTVGKEFCSGTVTSDIFVAGVLGDESVTH